MAKKPRNKKFDPKNHPDPTGKNVQTHQLKPYQFQQLVAMENALRTINDAKTLYLIDLCNREWGYPPGLMVDFTVNWQKGIVGVIIKGKAELPLNNNSKKEKSDEQEHDTRGLEGKDPS